MRYFRTSKQKYLFCCPLGSCSATGGEEEGRYWCHGIEVLISLLNAIIRSYVLVLLQQIRLVREATAIMGVFSLFKWVSGVKDYGGSNFLREACDRTVDNINYYVRLFFLSFSDRWSVNYCVTPYLPFFDFAGMPEITV